MKSSPIWFRALMLACVNHPVSGQPDGMWQKEETIIQVLQVRATRSEAKSTQLSADLTSLRFINPLEFSMIKIISYTPSKQSRD